MDGTSLKELHFANDRVRAVVSRLYDELELCNRPEWAGQEGLDRLVDMAQRVHHEAWELQTKNPTDTTIGEEVIFTDAEVEKYSDEDAEDHLPIDGGHGGPDSPEDREMRDRTMLSELRTSPAFGHSMNQSDWQADAEAFNYEMGDVKYDDRHR